MEAIELIKEKRQDALKTLKLDDIAEAYKLASYAYYNTSSPLIDDDLFDIIKDHLEKVAPDHPYLLEIGAPVSDSEKVKLPYWMGSLDKIRDDSKLINKWKKQYPNKYVISDKLDGNSGMLVIDSKGKYTLYSRGNGYEGQNISQLIPYLRLPEVKKEKGKIVECAVRGELIISKENWEKIKNKGANARNVVAGALHRKQADKEIAEKIDFVVYELLNPTPSKMTPREGLEFMKNYGFKVVHHILVDDISMDSLSQELIKRRNESPYEIDGIVIYHDETYKLNVGKNPKNAFAFKSIHTHTEAEVIVKDVEWTVSKDGYIKPTVLFPSVSISGVNISRATGFNAAFIEKNVIGPGAHIIIIRSGDVIPHIVRVLKKAANEMPSFPKDIPYKWNETHIDIIIESDENQQMKLKTLEHFAKTLEIKFVAKGVLQKMVNAGFDTIPKFLAITKQDILKLEGFKDASATKVFNSIQDVKKNVPCVDLMAASNLFGRGLSGKKIKVITDAFPSILKSSRELPSLIELEKVDGIGPATAKLFYEGISKFFKLLDQIEIKCHSSVSTYTQKLDSEQQHQHQQVNTKSLEGVIIVFTGFRNKEWETIIENRKGKVSTAISGKTSLVIASNKEEKSSKIDKAITLKIPILSKDEFMKEYGLP